MKYESVDGFIKQKHECAIILPSCYKINSKIFGLSKDWKFIISIIESKKDIFFNQNCSLYYSVRLFGDLLLLF